ncbi:polyphosphate--nucleotide phosphotransferase [Modestobacter marinus]|uniref:PPK2 family polyphosphate:nucleotide phosphotransferase n=1 Tax=Modestobacter marinus TaxID=477641 RepID=A0A846LPC0_9ACTN|nr:PPK2 family polyphosphate kinase [Modestobacter marinus]NIH67198.1 PPK2 family polyphosphate:nucleotide phosphotransferase [Modestobacter marinus]GGL52830.1 polyphosphate--nucleotide phosphotransferase [Modestobacter marinus]
MPDSLRRALRAPAAPIELREIDPRATPLAPGDKESTREATRVDAARLAELQQRLYAEASGGSRRRVLLVLQGMDTSGKGGVVGHVVGAVEPHGVAVTSFGRPTPEELRHSFLWRVRRALPGPGRIGVFDRSHYEDVLIGRVRELATPEVVERRYREIVRFERQLVAHDVTVVKVLLHLSPWEQKQRLLARLDDSSKRWKFDPADLDERARWPQYQQAHEAALERTDTDTAPWYVVPADRKWYRNWAVGRLLLETLTELQPRLPELAWDVDEQRDRLIEEHPISC